MGVQAPIVNGGLTRPVAPLVLQVFARSRGLVGGGSPWVSSCKVTFGHI